MGKRQPNAQQQEVIDFVQRGEGNGMVQAPPGSGKTTVAVAASEHLPEAIITSFSKATVTEVAERVQSFAIECGHRLRVKTQTLHSMGLATLRPLGITVDHVDGRKYTTMAYEAIAQRMSRVDQTFHQSVVALLNMKRQTAPFEPYTDEVFQKIALDYQIAIPLSGELWQIAMEIIPKIITEGFENIQSGDPLKRKIDFIDMLYLPFALELPFQTTPFLIVDETQDLNALQSAFVEQVGVERKLMVGDRFQAIFRFMGSQSNSVDLLSERFAAHQMAIPISYRCPIAVCNLASTLFPGMLPAPGAIEGDVHENVGEEELLPLARTCLLNSMSMMVLCRVRAPLVSQCLELISKGIQARVLGKDLGSEVSSILDALTRRRGFAFEHMMEQLVEHENAQCHALYQAAGNRDVTKQISDIQDKCSTLRALYLGFLSAVVGDKNIHLFRNYIRTLFVDDGSKNAILFMTGHASKGLEADVVVILEPNLLPHPMAISNEDIMAEKCLYYVMATRAKKMLIFIGGPRPDPLAFSSIMTSSLFVPTVPAEPSRLLTASAYRPTVRPGLWDDEEDDDDEEHPF